MKEIRNLNIFLASPGDVGTERTIVRSVVGELNNTIARAHGFHIDVIGHDTDTLPAMGIDPQSVVNDQIAEMSRFDLFVGIMWNRFGSPTPRAGSGTEEEFNRALDSFMACRAPQIMLYFGKMPALFDTDEDLSQRSKVISFQRRVNACGLTCAYGDHAQFEDFFRSHLTRWLLSQQSPEPPEAAVGSKEGQLGATTLSVLPTPPQGALPDSFMAGWILIGDRFYRADSVREKEGQITVALRPQGSDDDDGLREAIQRRGAVRFAYQNLAGPAEIGRGRRVSHGGDNYWEIEFLLRRLEPGYFTESTYGGFSSLQIATMKAGLILLDELPARGRDPLLTSFVAGFGNIGRVEAGVLPGLWRSFVGEQSMFPELARLWALYYLKSTNTVERVTVLEIGDVQDDGVRVRFSGLRHDYLNRDPERILLEGICFLGRR